MQKDITIKGLEIVKSAKKIFLESYTSILSVGKEALVSDVYQGITKFIYFCVGEILWAWTDISRQEISRTKLR